MSVKSSKDSVEPTKKDPEVPFAEREELSGHKNLGEIQEDEMKKIMLDLLERQRSIEKENLELRKMYEDSLRMKRESGEDTTNPVDDYLEKPAVFFSFSSTYSIYGDKRYGRESVPPRKEPIKFSQLYRYKQQGSKGVEVISVSQAVVRSKATYDWLVNHSLFNIKFFENIDKAQSVNVTLADKMVGANAVVSSMNDHQVIERCQRENIPIKTGDIAGLRKELIRVIAEQDLKLENERIVHKLRTEGESREQNDGRAVEYYSEKK
jgi:hypothetical protein